VTDLPDLRVARTSEATISYRDIGSGDQTLVCLHGGGPGATGWGNFGRNARDLSDRYRIIVPDLPGFGASRLTEDHGHTYVTTASRVVAEFMNEIGVEKASLLGNSMGGGLALTMAHRTPHLVDKLVLMGPWIYGLTLRIYSQPTSKLLQAYYPNPSIDKMRALIDAMAYNSDFPGAEELARARYEISLDPEIEKGYVRMTFGNGADPDDIEPMTFDSVRTIENPTLLLWGREDQFCSLDAAFMYLELLPNSDLVLFRDTGHWVMVEQAQKFAAHVAAFLG
jgi:pimeloyl-ACP methyl ester carboxylesterase